MLLFSFSLKAIEEIDISDKAVAAAVNEAIECNTNVSLYSCDINIYSYKYNGLIFRVFFLFSLQEIIADAHHQNKINE